MDHNDDETFYPAVSSNTLFHFTDEINYLINILNNNFRPRYCFENLSCLDPNRSPLGLGPVRDFAFPMVCFCDLPLSLTGRHLATYGNYGIGLTKEWGMRNRLSPILYVHQDSPLNQMIDRAAEIVTGLEFDNRNHELDAHAKVTIDVESLTKTFDHLLSVTKPYQGPFRRRNKTIPKVRFYDEREWRFLPSKSKDADWENYLLDSGFSDETEKNRQNDLIAADDNAALMFEPNDIRYIIVKDEAEILEMARRIEDIKADYDDARLLLKTRIISAQQIKEDF